MCYQIRVQGHLDSTWSEWFDGLTIANLANGPTWFVGDQFREGAQMMRSMDRNDVVKAMLQMSGGIMGEDPAEVTP